MTGSIEQSVWSLIRQTRSDPPGEATSNSKRAKVYGAALQQFEELMTSAATSGYATRPLPLFYAISQAGRAIAAAGADHPWTLTSHGLKHGRGTSPLTDTVNPDRASADSFSVVARATGQGELTAPVELGALWASLTDLYADELRDERWPRPLPVHPHPLRHAGGNVIGVRAFIRFDRAPNSPVFNYDNGRDPQFREALAAELAHYPTAADWQPGHAQNLLDRRVYDGWTVEIVWETPSDAPTARRAVLLTRIHEGRVPDEWWMRPSLNAAGDCLGPLMTWWALMFGLSNLARYHPAAWIDALRVDKHRETVPLEAAMNAALTAIPHYVLHELERVPTT